MNFRCRSRFYLLLALSVLVLAGLSLPAYCADRSTKYDFDGDGKTDISVYREGEFTSSFRGPSYFYYYSSLTDQIVPIQWGAGGDRAAPADYDNDGKTDVAVFRSWDESLPNPGDAANYWIKYSSGGMDVIYHWGYGLIVSHNFMGDAKAEPAVFYQRVDDSDPKQPCRTPAFLIHYDGYPYQKDMLTSCERPDEHRIPAIGDYNNDGISDIAIFGRSTVGIESSRFEVWYSPFTPGYSAPSVSQAMDIDFPIPGDYDGDGQTDFAGGKVVDGRLVWRIFASGSKHVAEEVFGVAGDVPVPGDYDGDGKTDLGIFRRSEATWYIRLSSNGSWLVKQFGTPTDVPVPTAIAY